MGIFRLMFSGTRSIATIGPDYVAKEDQSDCSANSVQRNNTRPPKYVCEAGTVDGVNAGGMREAQTVAAERAGNPCVLQGTYAVAGFRRTLQVIAVALFFFVPLQRELNQPVDQLFVGEPARLP